MTKYWHLSLSGFNLSIALVDILTDEAHSISMR